MCALRTFYLQVDGFLPQFSVQLHFLNPLTLVPSAQWNTSSIQFFLCGNFQKNLFVGRFHWLQTTLSKIQMCIIQLIVLYEVYLWGIIQQFICVKDSTRRPNKIPKQFKKIVSRFTIHREGSRLFVVQFWWSLAWCQRWIGAERRKTIREAKPRSQAKLSGFRDAGKIGASAGAHPDWALFPIERLARRSFEEIR